MTKIIPCLLLIVLLSACHKKEAAPPACPILFCPLQWPIVVTYVNNIDSAVVVKDFHAVDLRTDKPVVAGGTWPLKRGTYAVADYTDGKLFSAEGDDVQVTATDSLTNQSKTVTFKIALPACSCGMVKMSGPDTVKFN
jgi:hypothetical protein